MPKRLLPLGVFALAVVGAHAAADRLDDHLFALLHVLDRVSDFCLAFVIRGFAGLFGLSNGLRESLIESALEFIDFDAKQRWSVWLAIGFELLTDLLLLLAVLGPGTREADHTERREAGRALLKDPTLLRISSPLAVSILAATGMLVMAREVHVEALQLFSTAGLGGVGARMGTAVAASAALALATIFLVPRAWSRPLVRAHRFVTKDRERGRSGMRLRFRGVSSLLVLLPVALIAGREVSRLLFQLVGALTG